MPPTPDEIREARAAAGLSASRAGALVHVPGRTWQRWEAGQHPMPLGLWELFAIKASALVRTRAQQDAS